MIIATDTTHLGGGTSQQVTKKLYNLGDISCLMTGEE